MTLHGSKELSAVLSHIDNALTDDQMFAYLRFILVQNNEGNWGLGFGRIDLCHEGDMAEGPRYEYPKVKTLALKVPGKDFLTQFRSLVEKGGPYTINGITVGPLAIANWESREHWSDSNNDYASWPCVHTALQLERSTIDSVGGPFVSTRNFPYFGNVYELIHAVAGFRRFYFTQDARCRSVHLVVWKYRGRFHGVDFENGKLVIGVEGQLLGQAQVTGRAQGYNWEKQFRYLSRDEFEIPLQEPPQAVEAALVAENDELVDLIRTGFDISAQDEKQQPLTELIARCLRNGEGATVEYKPFVNLFEEGEGKRDEIVRTALAMANARGGYILLGVDDQGVANALAQEDLSAMMRTWKNILGITRKKEQKNDQQGVAVTLPSGDDEIREKVTQYGMQLRDLIQKRADKTLPTSVHVYFENSSPVLILEIASGEEKPYLDTRDNSVWFRANATNRRASATELAGFFRKEQYHAD